MIEKKLSIPINYSKSEEIANWVSHGIALLLSVLGAWLFLQRLISQHERNTVKWIGVSVYFVSLIALYAASTLYHLAGSFGKKKEVFRILDHGAIYLKIAGTYTPFLLLAIPDTYGYEILILLWVLAFAGIFFKIWFVNRFNIVSTIVYLIMGWTALLVIRPLYLSIPIHVFWFIVYGGVCFSIGVIFYLIQKLKYSHAIWHLFVMGGSAFHFISIYNYLI
ncbi:MAG: hemolysin III family protein [Bacteroidetes bacterium]|nr:hemolysin III family protein [Bacteroidota bacterium]